MIKEIVTRVFEARYLPTHGFLPVPVVIDDPRAEIIVLGPARFSSSCEMPAPTTVLVLLGAQVLEEESMYAEVTQLILMRAQITATVEMHAATETVVLMRAQVSIEDAAVVER